MGLPGGANTPPTVTWVGFAELTDAAMLVMRLDTAHPDRPRIESAAKSAISAIDAYLDRADDPIVAPAPQPLIDAGVQVTIELYRRKDAPFGVLNSWSDSDIGPVRIGSDPIKGVEELIRPYAHRYGVA